MREPGLRSAWFADLELRQEWQHYTGRNERARMEYDRNRDNIDRRYGDDDWHSFPRREWAA